jgi:uncharacterized membrane protein
MENFEIIFIVIAILGLFLFWKLARLIFKKITALAPKLDDSKDFAQSNSESNINVQFELTLKRLEADRLEFLAKNQGLFKRSFRKFWLILALIFIALGYSLSPDKTIDAFLFIGPIIASSALAAIVAGIYTLFKKGKMLAEFSKKLKKDFVSQLVYYVNPKLRFKEEGITEEEFDSADLFPSTVTSFTSEDKILGTVEDCKLTVSECVKRGKAILREETKLKIKGHTVSRDIEHGYTSTYVDYFRGLFIQLELKNINLSSTLKIVPDNLLKKEVQTGIEFTGFRPELLKAIPEENRLNHRTELEGKNYAMFCSAKEEAEKVANSEFISLVDYIFDQFHIKRDSNASDSFFGKSLFLERKVFLCIKGNILYLSIAWNRDLFEPDAFLKKSLTESNLAQEFYQDLKLIDDLTKEIARFSAIKY